MKINLQAAKIIKKPMKRAPELNPSSPTVLGNMDEKRRNYMRAQSEYRIENLKRDVKKEAQLKAGNADTVWGTGEDGRVYVWPDGATSWSEPNPQARLKYVEAASMGAGVWGIGHDQRIYTWNGTSWDEPNPAAGLYSVSAFSEDFAIGVGWEGYLYITWDAGHSWQALYSGQKDFYKVSVGHTSQNFLWALKVKELGDKIVYSELWHHDYATQTFNMVATPDIVKDVSATTGADGVWIITAQNSILKWDGSQWYEPNPDAKLYKIDCATSYIEAWGIGYAGRIFRTTDSGASWQEPNAAASLFHLSAN